jgi:Domain of unknown function (DUF4439)
MAPSERASAVRALQAALAAEHAAVYGYGVAGAHLSGAALTTATSYWVVHQRARDTLEAMLRQRGAQPVAAAAAYRLPAPVAGSAAAVSLAVLLENRVAAAYLGVVAVSSPPLRRFGAGEVAAAAARGAFWRGRTVAFPGFPAGTLRPSKTKPPASPAASG